MKEARDSVFRLQIDFFLFATSSISTTVTSVTRFGKILPLWQNFKILWQYFAGLFSIRQNFEPTLGYFHAISQIFIFENGQMLNK